jgi:alpha-tubulin suppressor-like RCC1 family protein
MASCSSSGSSPLAPAPDGSSSDGSSSGDAVSSNDTGAQESGGNPDSTVTGTTDAEAGAGMGPDEGPDVANDATVSDGAGDAPAQGPDGSTSCIKQIFGDHYLRTDGKLVYESSGHASVIVSGAPPAPLLGIVEVNQQGSDHACGLKNDGTVWCWALSTSGGNTYGDLGNGSIGGVNAGIGVATKVATNAAGNMYLGSVAHLSSGPNLFDGFNTVPTCAILTNKEVWCWGSSTAQTSMNDGLFWGTRGSVASVPYAIPMAAAAGAAPPVINADHVAVGTRHACLLLNGQVSCWGTNIAGNLGNGDVTEQFKAYPVPVVTGYGLPGMVDSIGCGADFSCALGGGSVWCWGQTAHKETANPSVMPVACGGQLCDPQPTPVQAAGLDGGSTLLPDAGVDQNPLTGVTSLIVGDTFACALDKLGTIWCWGNAATGGTSLLPLATPYTSATLPFTSVAQIAVSGFEATDALRYLTAPGVYVVGKQPVMPYCQ